mmetsp:Transcript_90086/g.241562  ORF Transcript_90086/g.241562 Transcript_90086/m.241562 type:complete len:153 (-) Transcript_90086:190-648(-)
MLQWELYQTRREVFRVFLEAGLKIPPHLQQSSPREPKATPSVLEIRKPTTETSTEGNTRPSNGTHAHSDHTPEPAPVWSGGNSSMHPQISPPIQRAAQSAANAGQQGGFPRPPQPPPRSIVSSSHSNASGVPLIGHYHSTSAATAPGVGLQQ